MNKSLLISLTTATLLSASTNTMYERFQNMELELTNLKGKLKALEQENINNTQAVNKDKRFQNIELKLLNLKEEIKTLRAESVKKIEIIEEELQTTTSNDESDNKSDDDVKGDISEDEEDEFNVEEAFEEIDETLSDLNKATSGNHLKLGVDYRFAVENLQYNMADDSEHSNDAFITNRFWLNMDWAATENLSFTGQIAYNKAFGARSAVGQSNSGYETFDWITNENAYDDTIRVRSVYFLYRNDTFFEAEIPWTFSIGRRPSTNGHLINLRDDDKAASPMGHSINVEFDGLSSKFSFDEWVDGMYIKFCAGRGMSNALPKFTSTPYAQDSNDNPNIDLMGLIFTPYDNGHYGIHTQYYYANNLIDADVINGGFETIGGMHSFTANFTANGIGDEINDYLDDTTFFLSGALSMTDPKSDKAMLNPMEVGESQTGYSLWTGLQMPSFMTDDGRWGLEYNYGSQYWRSITYGEDTNIGSKLAARGSAYEAYFTEYLVEDILSLQLRYTYIDYEYTGSNGFFGTTTGSAISMEDAIAFGMGDQVVDSAQDIRFYLRYKY
jgi:hypothetical protein